MRNGTNDHLSMFLLNLFVAAKDHTQAGTIHEAQFFKVQDDMADIFILDQGGCPFP